MGVVEAKLSVKADEPSSSSYSSSSLPPPPPPPIDSMDAVNGILIALELEEENSADGVRTPGIDPPDDDAGFGDDLESLKKGEEEAAAENDAEPQLPQRSDEPDCDFYIKTGTCKFGLNCKFNHPVQKRRLRTAWARMKKPSVTNVQAAKDENEWSGSKIIGQTTRKYVVENKVGTPFKRMEQTEKKGVAEVKQTPSRKLEQKDHKNVVVKPKGYIVVEKTEKKEEKQNSSVRLEQQTPKVQLKKQQWKAVQVEEKEKEIANNVIQAKSEHGIIESLNKVKEKEKEIANNVVQAKSEVVKDKHSRPQRMKQEDNKGVKKKQIPSDRMQHQDNKAAKKMSRETAAEKVGVTECRYHVMPGGCKFGKSCKFVHSQKKKEVVSVELNFLGLPIRPGEKECSFYMRTGNCKLAAYCKYHHPDPTVTTVQQDPLSGCQSSQSMQQIGFGASPLPMMPNPTEGPFHVATSFMVAPPTYSPGPNLHPQGLHSNPECNGYQVHADGYPDRSSQLECQQFLNFGVCQFGSTCPFHHPKPQKL